MQKASIQKGIIASIQMFHHKTIAELAIEVINAGCVGLRVDKRIELDQEHKTCIIGLRKVKVNNIKDEPFITPDIETIDKVTPWCDFVAIDYRRCNKGLKEVSAHCAERKILVVADIENMDDYQSLRDLGLYYTYVATTLSVFSILYRPDLKLLETLIDAGETKIIAEGNYSARSDVKTAFEIGAHAVCIGGAIANPYKLARKYTSIPL